MTKNPKIDLMEKQYSLGNFFMARKKAFEILNSPSVDMSQRKKAKDILAMTGIDKLVILAGVLSFLFIVFIAFIVRYKG